MLKRINYFFIAIFPYYILFVLFCMFSGYLEDQGLILLIVLVVLYVVALVCSVITFIVSFIKKKDAKDILRANMIIKLIHIPAYILIFIIGLFSTITIFTFGISIFLMILDGMTIVLSGLIGLGGIIRSLKEKRISRKLAGIHGVFQFIFCLDVVSSIIIYRIVKIKKEDNDKMLQ